LLAQLHIQKLQFGQPIAAQLILFRVNLVTNHKANSWPSCIFGCSYHGGRFATVSLLWRHLWHNWESVVVQMYQTAEQKLLCLCLMQRFLHCWERAPVQICPLSAIASSEVWNRWGIIACKGTLLFCICVCVYMYNIFNACVYMCIGTYVCAKVA